MKHRPIRLRSIRYRRNVCRVAVWVGPRAQVLIKEVSDVKVLCFPCAVERHDDHTVLLNLGGTHKEAAN